MFGIGFLELVVVAVVALIVLGPQKLPGVMQQLGRLFLQVKRISNEVKESLDHALQDVQVTVDSHSEPRPSQAKNAPPLPPPMSLPSVAAQEADSKSEPRA